MTNRDIIKGEAYLDMLKDKARETDELAKENLGLRRKINKAIEYIEKNSYTTLDAIDDINFYIVRLDTCDDLLDILKGVDKE